jgi:hypothetical protein
MTRDSTPLFFEYEEVLCRPRQFAHLSRRDVDDFLDCFASVSEFRRVLSKVPAGEPASGDEMEKTKKG